MLPQMTVAQDINAGPEVGGRGRECTQWLPRVGKAELRGNPLLGTSLSQ